MCSLKPKGWSSKPKEEKNFQLIEYHFFIESVELSCLFPELDFLYIKENMEEE